MGSYTGAMAAYPAEGVQAMTSYPYHNRKLPNPGLVAGVDGRYFYGWANDVTGIAAETILTADTFRGILEPNRRYIIELFYMHVSTLSDWVTVEWGVTTNQDGSGTFTARTPKFRIDTGNVQSGQEPKFMHLRPLPIVLTDAAGGAFTARVQGNDAGATATIGWNGWYEDIE